MIWFFLFLISAPLLVFSTKPSLMDWRRSFYLLISIAYGYALLNLMFNIDYENGSNIYKKCQSQFTDGGIQHHDECGNPPHGGAPHVFYLFFGWIPATGYVGFWEYIWRRKNKSAINALGKKFAGKWTGNFAIAIAIPVTPYAFLLMVIMVYVLAFRLYLAHSVLL